MKSPLLMNVLFRGRAATLFAPAALVAALAAAASAQAADVNVSIEGVVGTEGKVMTALFDKASEFPRGKLMLASMVNASPGTVKVVFTDVPPGRYAVSTFHDVNGNQRLDANMIGIPSEPYGFSRDARGKMGPPSFNDAVFEVGNEPVNLTVRVK